MYVPVTLPVSGAYTLGFEDLALRKSEVSHEWFQVAYLFNADTLTLAASASQCGRW